MARILVVEDNADIAQLLILLLGQQGHEARCAADASGALSALQRDIFDAALMDIGLPGMNGLQLAHRVRGLYGRQLRLIALTGYLDSIISRRKVLDAGFDEVLRKPIDFPTLLALLGSSPDNGGTPSQ